MINLPIIIISYFYMPKMAAKVTKTLERIVVQILVWIFIFYLSSYLQTWMYIAFPVLLYAGERIFRAIRSGSYEVDIMKVFNQTSSMFSYS